MKSNVDGFFNLIDLSKTYKVKHLIMQVQAVYMVQIKKYHLMKMIKQIVLCNFTLQQKNLMNL